MPIQPKNLRFHLSVDGLGGPITGTVVDGNTLFPPVKGVEAEKGLVDHRCIYFINTDDEPDGLFDASLWFDRAVNDSTLEMGVDPAGLNGQAQRLAASVDSPIGVSFSAPTTEVWALPLPGKAYRKGDYIALWLRRSVPKGSPPQTEQFVLNVTGESY